MSTNDFFKDIQYEVEIELFVAYQVINGVLEHNLCKN